MIRLTLQGQVGDILYQKMPVKLKKIDDSECKVVSTRSTSLSVAFIGIWIDD